MKRSPIKRKRRKARGGDDPKRLAFVRTLPCSLWAQAHFEVQCWGPVEAHHPIGLKWGKGMSTKSPDKYAIPLCARHHGELHARNGDFANCDVSVFQDFHVERVMKLPC